MPSTDIETYIRRSRALDLSHIDWRAVPRHPLSAEAVRTLQYMQDIESHTIMYLRQVLATRAVDDSGVAAFLACWLYEETFHGRALQRFLEAAGHAVVPRQRSRMTAATRLESLAAAVLSRLWPDFVAVHMTWGAINELTTLTGYRRLAEQAAHPVLTALLARIMRDESRHFGFYFGQAQQRLGRPQTARRVRLLVERFWAPVGSGVQPAEETRFLARYLFSTVPGRTAARQVDAIIRRLPGFDDLPLLEAWIDRELAAALPRGGRLPADAVPARAPRTDGSRPWAAFRLHPLGG